MGLHVWFHPLLLLGPIARVLGHGHDGISAMDVDGLRPVRSDRCCVPAFSFDHHQLVFLSCSQFVNLPTGEVAHLRRRCSGRTARRFDAHLRHRSSDRARGEEEEAADFLARRRRHDTSARVRSKEARRRVRVPWDVRWRTKKKSTSVRRTWMRISTSCSIVRAAMRRRWMRTCRTTRRRCRRMETPRPRR